MSKQDGGPAFPVARGTAADGSEYADAHYPGMTLRDYFAGQALAGMSALDALKHHASDQMAQWAYEQADAMLAERERQ